MSIIFKHYAPVGIGLLLLAGCAPTTADRAPVAARAPVIQRGAVGLDGIIGVGAAALAARFGPSQLDIREGTARKLQFATPVCVLDAYLYPPRAGADPVVTHVDTRLPDGRDIDRASCVAAIAAGRQGTR